MQPASRIRLSVGASTPVKIFATFVVVIFVGIVLSIMAIAFGIGSAANSMFEQPAGFGDQPFDTVTTVTSGAAVLMGLCGVTFLLVGLYLLLSTWRAGAWLRGTVVSRRGALLTRCADLAVADVSMAGINYRQNHHHGSFNSHAVVRVPALAAVAPGATRPLKIPLRGQGLDLLPGGQLRALADALDANHGPR